jgi:predicted RNase H-like nuclease (RuvC/YqgF family)
MNDNANATNNTQDAAQETTQTVDTESLQAELERLKSENAKLKNAQSNASADASKYKKQLQERMSEQERVATETKELIEQLQADNAALKRAQALAENEAGYIGLGFDAATAKKAAAATFDGDFAGLMGVFKAFLEAHDKALQAEMVRQTPRPGAGGADKAITREQFNAMGYKERVELYEKQPEVYKQFTNKKEE